jgi:PPOX class probable F420-dependent enzyme
MNLSPDEARSRFAAARVARLATVDEAGHPHLVPVVFAVHGNEIVMAIDHKPKARREVRRLANIRANPAVSMIVDHYDEDWTTLWWVRADGTAEVTETPVDPLVTKYPQYQRIRPAGPTILVQVTRWTGWAGT